MVSVPTFGSIKKHLGNLCMPSKIYLAISVFFLLFAAFNSFSLMTVIVKLVFIAVWTFILNWICSKDYEIVSWILVVFPYVLFFLFFFLGIDILKNDLPKGEKGEKDEKGEKVEKEQKGEKGEKEQKEEKNQPSVDVQKNIDMTVQPHIDNTDLYSKQNRQYVSF
jgi:hypothetical protein